MNTTHRPLLVAASSLVAVCLSNSIAPAQDLADRRLELAMRRSFLWEYWAARQQEQVDFAHYRSHASFGQYGLHFGPQSHLGYRAIAPRQFYGPVLPASNGYAAGASATCIGPLGIECSPLDCDCDPYDYCY